ncbi:MAG: hypothetical protein WCN88_02185 [Candidatus Falkowbacteria bacterium]
MTKPSDLKNEWLSAIRMKNLPLAGKFYYNFSVISLVLVALTNYICYQSGASVETSCVRIILSFLTIYFIILPLAIIMKSRYQQDRNIIASAIPALMAIIGILLSLCFRSLQLACETNIFAYLGFPLAIFIPPLTTSFLSRSLCIRPLKLYASSFFIIIMSSLITMFFLFL